MDSRERLIAAMCDLIWERGYSATSPRLVRQRSGVGQGSMYHFFPTKRDLGIAAIERNCKELENRLAVLHDAADPLGALIAYIEFPRSPLRGCKAGRLTQDAAVMADDELRAPVARAFATTHDALVQAISRAVDAGQLPANTRPAELADMITAALQGAYVPALAQQDPAPYRRACRGLAAVLRELAADAPSAVDNKPPTTPSAGDTDPNPADNPDD